MKRLETSKRINPEEIEVLVERVESLEIENTRLKKYIQCLKSRNKKEQDQKEAQYKQSQNKIGTLSDELTAVNEQSIKYRENIDLLRNSLQNIETKYTSASKRIKILENELSNSHSSSDRAEEMNDTVQKLVKEFGVCLNEMNSLSILSKQVVSGEDPNLSLLLGVERLSFTLRFCLYLK
ncbi:CEP85 [Lepeophtheirus salmonis]|uniref:CEP85 n=1 Tax=Lepeophtheirus salmonis TaxID=72036 RepID=A0A7R8D456_LEPSM|nr:CEP85 [Lepeophtheirus salmonis]CAF3023154.1 CEP85 [Lepeophtheirus salmonis]